MKRLLSMVVLLGSVAVFCSEASANIKYAFSGVAFSDGGTLTGTFTTNDTDTALLGFNLTTTAGSSLTGFNYKPGTADSSSTSLPAIIVMDAPNQVTLTDILQVTFTHLTPSGSSIKTGNFDSFEQHLDVHRFITAGSVIAVPEPSAFGVMGAGLAVAGLLVLRRRQI